MAGDVMVHHPGQVSMDQGKYLIHQACCPTDSLGTTLFAFGLKAHIDELCFAWPALDLDGTISRDGSLSGLFYNEIKFSSKLIFFMMRPVTH
jgi:hypothetical protein